MKKIIVFVLASIMLISLAGCSGTSQTATSAETTKPAATVQPATVQPTTVQPSATKPAAQPVSFKVVKSNESRVESPDLSEAQLATLVGGNSQFALDLYRILRQEREDNFFYSPYSVSLALAMTYAGARGETEKEMADTLHYLLPQDTLHPAFNGLDLELKKRGEGAKGKDSEGFRLNVVNAIWGQKDYQFLSEYLDILAENYGAGLRVLDFAGAAEESRLTINDWVSDQTEGRIKDLIKEGIINSLTRLVLTNAIYFNAAWQHPFDADNTVEAMFNLLDGGNVSVQMMHQTEMLGYTEGQGYQAVELKYDGGELSMVMLLPEEGNFKEFESSLDIGMLEEIIVAIGNKNVTLSMPKFEYESEFGLKKTLEVLGMKEAFSMAADFSGMTGKTELFVQDVVHKAFVSVDEAGTEAAAATAVIMQLKAMPAEPVEVTIDRPFIYLIRDIETGTILFLGRVVNPAG
ncbi:MAG: serpin family protein [Dehalococcoidales bacterium]|nr:serpin family protein [Dehalococcoidales bacterium]